MAVPTRRVTQHLQKVLDVNGELIEIARALNAVKKSTSDPDEAKQLDRQIGRLIGASEQIAQTITTLARDVIHAAEAA